MKRGLKARPLYVILVVFLTMLRYNQISPQGTLRKDAPDMETYTEELIAEYEYYEEDERIQYKDRDRRKFCVIDSI